MTMQRYCRSVVGLSLDPEGDWVRFSDIPQPPPWLEKPTEAGWWWMQEFVNDPIVVHVFDDGPWPGRYQVVGSRDVFLIGGKNCLWQRIPEAVPPTVEESTK